ncbi:hypothetical protein BY996DRAFT_6541185 [Phakopsora pachyrhizi]|nr:hypothetical protein BY996DRAFT_6541185 [Phakopsora pachyrhizi]
MVELRTHREEGLIARGGRAVAHKYLWRYQIRRSQIAISKWIDKRLLGQMEEISAEAKLLIGLCYEICFLTVCGLRELLRFVYHLAGFRLCRLRSVQRRVQSRRMNKADLGKQMRLVMTSNGNEGMGGGAGSGDDTPSKGWLNTEDSEGCLRGMIEGRIINDSVKSVIAIRDWRPADWVKVWSCLQKLAEEEGEENHRLDNPFNIW